MSLSKTTSLYEVLIRLNADGTVRGAHQISVETIKDGATILSEKELGAVALEPEDVSDLLGENIAAVVSENTALAAAKATADTALSGKDAEIATLVSNHEAAIASLTASKDAEIASLTAQVTALTPTVSATSIHAAYFRAALADMGVLAAVDAAVTAAGPLKVELWKGASSISITDPDVVAIAAALEIDLDAVLAEAQSIMSGNRT